jgi:hypothetical protein
MKGDKNIIGWINLLSIFSGISLLATNQLSGKSKAMPPNLN